MTLSVAIAGCGMIAGGPVRDGRPIATNHAAACLQTPGLELVAAADPDEARRLAFARQWNVARVYPTIDEMLVAHQPDIVIVATPAATHEAVCMRALESNARGILCEKPFTGHGAGAARVARACVARGVPLAVNFSRRWDTSHADLAAAIATGAIGVPRVLFGTYTGTLRGNGSHLIDTLRMLLPGDWNIAHVEGAAEDDDGAVSVWLRGPHDAEAHIAPVREAEYFVFELDLLGTRGRARLLAQGLELRLDHPRPSSEFPGYRYLAEGPLLGQRTLLNAFPRALEALRDAVTGATPLPTAATDYVPTLSLLDDVLSRAQKEESS